MSRLKQNESITHIMSKDLQTINSQTPLSTVGKIFAESGFHHLPVVSGEKLVGIVSFVDLMRVSFKDSFGVTAQQTVYDVLDRTLDVEAIMTKNPVTVCSNDTIKHAASILARGDFHALPIVGDDQQLLGLVTSADLINYLLEQY
ncbi:CBS domain-containing protein [Adhaeretor mobilis]|uniref:Inosine 5'-monophosphate dehydrogenase n=1 Tax=Adhaeretor mobilis TaxID=1930276 RepID=A0A517MZX5_9BACT|nr:CBS domain-containing protein [Adhaeretor mobilis]QDT00442.1 inosine 5'-monophosphate dehydrogenase [Adhaeretor mobilis]